MRGDQDEAAALGEGRQQVLVALETRQQPLGPALASIGADEIGEADREMTEDVVDETLVLDRVDLGTHARDVGATARARRETIPSRAGKRARQSQAGRPRQRAGRRRRPGRRPAG